MMRLGFRNYVLWISLTLWLLGSFAVAQEADQTQPANNVDQEEDHSAILIGAGNYFGDDYKRANVFCRFITPIKNIERRGCKVMSGQSLSNIYDLEGRVFDFAIVADSWLDKAFKGDSPAYFEKAYTDIQRVMHLPPRYVTVFVAVGSTITNLEGLTDKRVDIGLPGSDGNDHIQLLLADNNFSTRAFAEVYSRRLDLQIEAACAGEIDALVIAFSRGEQAIWPRLDACGFRPLSLNHQQSSRYMMEMGDSISQETDVLLIGKSLVALDSLSDTMVYAFLENLSLNIGRMSLMLPKIDEVSVATMTGDNQDLKGGDVLEYHAGAIRYYKERGLLSN